MRLLFVSPCVEDEFFGGVQLTARLAIKGLAERQDAADMKVLCYGPRCGCTARSSSRLCSRSKAQAAWNAAKVRGWGQKLVFWHLDLLKLLPFIGRGSRPTYLFLHGIECWRPLDGFTRRLVDSVDMFLTNSEFTWRRFTEMNPRWKSSAHRTIQLGLGLPEHRIDPPGAVPAAIIIARMNAAEAYKGHRELIEAWPLVVERAPEAELWIVGGGDAAGDLQSLAAAGPAARHIRFFGVLPEQTKENLLRQSRCLVLPSLGEGFGLVYLEAMRLGRPCLSSIHDAGSEVIGHPESGIAVEPRDPRALAAAVVELLNTDSRWQQWSSNARQRYEAKFTAAHFEKRLAGAVLEGEA
jgi:phosphatidylinositol alpha-1,6-mannosyltransferase